jgi:16S rRNA C967 or C1407 C5-methylase (RsmB/RsmF family)
VRTERVHELQSNRVAFFSNACRSVRAGGGVVVYSTCTICPSNNDDVVRAATTILAQQYGVRMCAANMADTVAQHLDDVHYARIGSRHEGFSRF